ncbi:MAG: CHASE2 domain-containing protein, partial [Cyanobacteria bacterium P01_C01_bin.38]
MWSLLKNKIWQWRSVLITAPSVTAIVFLLRFSGLLQMLELAALDQLFIRRLPEKPDNRIVIVKLDEESIAELGHPISDRNLAQILKNIKQHQPRAIGLDIYRDIPVGEGYDALKKVFESTPNLVGVQKLIDSADSSAVDAPPILKKLDRQVAANDFPIDVDGKIRRIFFYLSNEEESLFSFSFRLANIYFKDVKKIEADELDNGWIKFGKVIFKPFTSNDGGYVRAQDEGFQVLINYRGDIEKFQSISISDVFHNRVDEKLIRGRIVLIGPTATSLKDLFYTPYTSNLFATPRRMAGVTIHANAISQILDAELSNRPIIKTPNQLVEWIWIYFWSLLGAILIWSFRSSKIKIIPLSTLFLAVGCLASISYIAFIYGWWIPVVPPMLGIIGSTVGVTAYLAQNASKIRKTFGRYLNDEVVANLLESREG